MITRHNHKNLSWVDLVSPTPEEVRALTEEFDLHPFMAEELLRPSVKQKAETHGEQLYVVLHFPSGRGTKEQEVDFIVGKHFLITNHYESINPMHSFSKSFEMNSLLGHGGTSDHGGHLLCLMIRRFYHELTEDIDALRANLNRIEDRIFIGKEQEMVFDISRTSRSILDFRRALVPHKDILASLELVGGRLFGQDFAFYARTLQGDHLKVFSLLDELRDTVQELRDTNDSLLTTKQNETMRVLTIMALLTFPLSLFVAIFDINAKHNPIIGIPYDFWIIVGTVVLAAGLMLWYFRHKRWL